MSAIRTQRILLRSAARTVATATSAVTTGAGGNVTAVGPYFDYAANTLRAYLNVTVASGTGGLTLQLRGIDKASGATYVLLTNAAAITATGLYLFEIAPSLVAGSGNRTTFNAYLPVQWDINIAVGDASSYTYSLSVETTS